LSGANDTLRPLPILTADGRLPTGDALATLRLATLATGYPGRVLPSKAFHGSPGPILAVGVEPDWLVEYALVPDWSSATRLTEALKAILINPDDPRIGRDVDLLSKWFGGEVKYLGEEEYHEQQEAERSNQVGFR
jgi:hypothetical protein